MQASAEGGFHGGVKGNEPNPAGPHNGARRRGVHSGSGPGKQHGSPAGPAAVTGGGERLAWTPSCHGGGRGALRRPGPGTASRLAGRAAAPVPPQGLAPPRARGAQQTKGAEAGAAARQEGGGQVANGTGPIHRLPLRRTGPPRPAVKGGGSRAAVLPLPRGRSPSGGRGVPLPARASSRAPQRCGPACAGTPARRGATSGGGGVALTEEEEKEELVLLLLSRGPARLRLWLPPSPCRRLPVPGAAAAASSASSAPTPPSSEGRTGAASPRWPSLAAGTVTAAASAHRPAAAGGLRASPLRPQPARPPPPPAGLHQPSAAQKPGPFPYSGLSVSPRARSPLTVAGNPRGAAGSRAGMEAGRRSGFVSPGPFLAPPRAPVCGRSAGLQELINQVHSELPPFLDLAGAAPRWQRPARGSIRRPRCPAERRRP